MMWGSIDLVLTLKTAAASVWLIPVVRRVSMMTLFDVGFFAIVGTLRPEVCLETSGAAVLGQKH
ncbi:hypothetical protein CEPID_01130 [Corynebacterium epidermidicanis]|uniref:Uncharacterized protein n=1 Tax=Corynebacterium epidermidicanis TaxID=1050174 RepID=A0A0G3GNK1_9CORY|nr:hypothetical protein CEPID_01130 [Corynebacterium epidermidicanis]